MVDAAEFALAHDGAFGGVASEGRGVPGASRHDRRVLVLEGEHDGQGNPAVSVTLLGLRDVDLFRRVAATLSESDRLPEEERLALEAYGARLRAEGKLEM